MGAGLLAACQVSTDTDPSGQGKKKPKSKADGGGDGLQIPDSGAEIPSGDVSIQWMDSGDLKALFANPVFEAYQKKYPNVTIDYQDSPWDTINEAIPLAIRNESAPDVFQMPQTVPVQTAINDGWIKPIDDIVPNFEEWKSGFPEGMFLEGIHTFDGKTYTWPYTGSKRIADLLFFDPEYMTNAGYDPIAERFTWSTLREACKKITEQGDGEYFGLLTAGDGMGSLVLSLARLAGLRGVGEPPFDFQTGQYVADDDIMVAAFELMLAIKSDGSFFPGSMGLGDADSRARMPTRVAGMIFDGPWDIPEWQTTNPEYEFDIAPPPYGDDQVTHYWPYQENGVNFMYVAATTENDAIVGDLFHYMGSVEGQTQLVLLSEGNLTSVIAEANETATAERAELDPLALKAIGYADELMRIAPQVQARTSEVAKVLLELEPVTPSLMELGESILAGETKDVKKALTEYNDKAEQNLDKAIDAARKKGAEISRDDYVFENWDPTKDYTQADYEALGQ